MVYCVVPREMECELFTQLTAYYAADPEVAVIVDRRHTERRRRRAVTAEVLHQRVLRDRRRRRTVGEFAPLHDEGAASDAA